jgi:prepilin-type processing-associated H-X9-DG protein
LHCPIDKQRTPADSFNGSGSSSLLTLKNNALSYAIGTEATEGNSSMHIVVDRNVVGTTNKSCTLAGLNGVSVTLNPYAGNTMWTSELHNNEGNMALVDGSVQQFSQFKLLEHLANTGDTNYSNCILKPD